MTPNRIWRARRSGYSLVEMLIVVSMIGLMGLFAWPKIAMVLNQRQVGSARLAVLNKFNQVHACKNVFVTDGSFMASSACQNPSLTYMAFTARAADHAVAELRKGNL